MIMVNCCRGGGVSGGCVGKSNCCGVGQVEVTI